MLDFEVFAGAFVPADISVDKMCNSEHVLLNFAVELSFKDPKDILGTDETVSVVIEQEEGDNMGLPERHGLEPITDLLELLVSDVSAELIKV